MKLLKTKLLTITALLLWASIAQGVCNLTGYPIRVTSLIGATYLFFRVSHTANYYYIGRATDPFVAATINESYSGKTKVFVQSSRATCPAPATGSNWIGEIQTIKLGV